MGKARAVAQTQVGITLDTGALIALERATVASSHSCSDWSRSAEACEYRWASSARPGVMVHVEPSWLGC